MVTGGQRARRSARDLRTRPPREIQALLRGLLTQKRGFCPSLARTWDDPTGAERFWVCGLVVWLAGGWAGKGRSGPDSSSRLPHSVPGSAEAIIPAASGGAGAGSHPEETRLPRTHAFDGAAAPSPAPGRYNCRRAGVRGNVPESWPQQGPSSSSSQRAPLSTPSRPRTPEDSCSRPRAQPLGYPRRPRTLAPQRPRHAFQAGAPGPQRRLPPAWIRPDPPKARPPRRRRSAASARRSARSSCSCWSSSSDRPCTPTSTCGSVWLRSRCYPSPGSR